MDKQTKLEEYSIYQAINHNIDNHILVFKMNGETKKDSTSNNPKGFIIFATIAPELKKTS